MGAVVNWDTVTQTATAVKDDTVVILTVGSLNPKINGQDVQIDQPAIALDGRTLAPVSFVAAAFGGAVLWDGGNLTVTITTK